MTKSKERATDMSATSGDIGTVQVEQTVLLACVAVGFAAATAPLLGMLVGLSRGIEIVLSLPIP